MKKVLIANAVPTNNGDAALVFGLKDKLEAQGYEVLISTTRFDTVKILYPEVKWVKAEYDFNKFQRVVFNKLPKLKKYYFKRKVSRNNEYSNIDIIISAPGGYINSYYGIYDKLECLKLIKQMYSSKLVMYSQSVGPLNEKDTKVLEEYINIFDLFMVRDEISYNNVKKHNNVLKTNDAAFLLDIIQSKDNKEKIAGISVRNWNYDGRDNNKYNILIKGIIKKCVDNGYRVELISTCQGLENYLDDSIKAKEIIDLLDEKYKKYVEVNYDYYSLNDLRKYISKFKFVVGTRLHMCILSIMSGVPAFNISYEIKGKECYKILGLSEFSIDYNEEINSGMKTLENFIENINNLRVIYIKKSKEMNEEANKYFNYMISILNKG